MDRDDINTRAIAEIAEDMFSKAKDKGLQCVIEGASRLLKLSLYYGTFPRVG